MSFNSLCQKGILDVTPVVVCTTQLSFFTVAINFMCSQLHPQSSASNPETQTSFKFTIQYELFLSLARMNQLNDKCSANQTNMGHLSAISGALMISPFMCIETKQCLRFRSSECVLVVTTAEKKCLQTIVCTAFGNAAV